MASKNKEVFFMTKSNNKKHRTDGTITSSGIEFPSPITNKNTPTSTYDYTDKQRIHQQTRENNKS